MNYSNRHGTTTNRRVQIPPLHPINGTVPSLNPDLSNATVWGYEEYQTAEEYDEDPVEYFTRYPGTVFPPRPGIMSPTEVDRENIYKFKNAQLKPSLFPPSYTDASYDYIGTTNSHRKGQKRRKPPIREQLHKFPPMSSIKVQRPTPMPTLNGNNVSLKATFFTPEVEESSSVELELSLNGKLQENQLTNIQIENPESSCLQIVDRNRKRTLLNVWSYSNGKLKLESQREMPEYILNGTNIVDGELLNRAEIPKPISDILHNLLAGIGRSDNATLLNKFHLPISGENLFGGSKRRNVIMVHYILWGQREHAWRLMLDKTVESYLRNYFINTFGAGRSHRSNSESLSISISLITKSDVFSLKLI